MAEGWARYLKGGRIEAHSAGTNAQGLNLFAVQVMAEAGVDISNHRSKNVAELVHLRFDFVVTVCDQARESCPLFPGTARMIHRGFADPPHLAKGAKTEEEALQHYRRIRDEIRDYVLTLPEAFPVD